MAVNNVRLTDLAGRAGSPRLSLLSVRLPVQVLDRVDVVARQLRSRKAVVIVALLNEGLDRFEQQKPRRGRPKRQK